MNIEFEEGKTYDTANGSLVMCLDDAGCRFEVISGGNASMGAGQGPGDSYWTP